MNILKTPDVFFPEPATVLAVSSKDFLDRDSAYATFKVSQAAYYVGVNVSIYPAPVPNFEDLNAIGVIAAAIAVATQLFLPHNYLYIIAKTSIFGYLTSKNVQDLPHIDHLSRPPLQYATAQSTTSGDFHTEPIAIPVTQSSSAPSQDNVQHSVPLCRSNSVQNQSSIPEQSTLPTTRGDIWIATINEATELLSQPEISSSSAASQQIVTAPVSFPNSVQIQSSNPNIPFNPNGPFNSRWKGDPRAAPSAVLNYARMVR